MKTFKLYKINCIKVVAILIAIICIAACTDEEIMSGTVEEGTPVTVNFQISVPKQDLVITSRSVSDETANKVENLYVLGFKTNGEKAFGFYYTTELAGGKTTELKSQSTIPAGTYDIYAIANIGSDVYGVDENTDNTGSGNLKSFLDNSALTKSELLTKAVSILTSARSLDRSGASLLMAGALCNVEGKATSIAINQEDQKLETINLKRLDSEITFNFKGADNVSFTAKRWYVMNAPTKSYLLEQATTDASNTNSDFFNTYKEKEEDRTQVYNNTFTFYMPENKKQVKKAGCESYSDREKEVKKNDLNDVDPKTQRRNYEYAPDNGTYVVVTGHYEGPQKGSISIGASKDVTAEVQYIIHLGYVNKVANDFFSERNVKYTYNVTVNGVDNIILEVEKEEEKQPGATGDVVLGGSENVYTLDAHYETVLLTFDYEELRKAWGDGTIADLFTSVVTTPYTSMLGSNHEASDQKWVKVIRNANASEEFQSYYAVKDRLQTVQEMLDELKFAVVNQNQSIFTNGKITYTCFVDEFYYEEEDLPVERTKLADPTNIWKSFVNRPNRKMYIICNRKYSLDQESSIISSKYVISQRSIQTFYSTEPTPNEKVIAYGIETLNETGNLPTYGAMATPSLDNGWENSQRLLTSPQVSWSDVYDGINGYKNLEMNKTVNKYGNLNPGATDDVSNYLRAMAKRSTSDGLVQAFTYSCMQRNRRESSSGNAIDDADLKWYLPSINQYQSFYIGEPAISQESRLFDYPSSTEYITSNSYQFIKHYGSSYALGGHAFNVLIIWAEEATSVSTLRQQQNWIGSGGSSEKNPEALLLRRTALPYRCVRNLGSDGTSGVNTPGEYTPYRNVDKKPNGLVEFKVDQLSPLLRSRGRAIGELGPHFYQDRANQFYTNGFEVNIITNKFTTIDKATGVDPSGTGCEPLNVNLPAGEAKWRVPNLRELTLMWQEGVINDDLGVGRATSRTQMPYKYASNNFYRKGWTVTRPMEGGGTETNLGMSKDDNHLTTVRCVRDLK